MKVVTKVVYEFNYEEALRLAKRLDEANMLYGFYRKKEGLAGIAFECDCRLWAELNGVLKSHSTVIHKTISDFEHLDEIEDGWELVY